MEIYRIILSSWLMMIWSVINGWGKWCLNILCVCVYGGGNLHIRELDIFRNDINFWSISYRKITINPTLKLHLPMLPAASVSHSV